MTPSRPAILCFLLFAGFVPLLVVVPTLVPPDPTVLSAASKAGYNTVLAYQAVALWVALSFVVICAAARQGWLPLASTTSPANPVASANDEHRSWPVLVAVAIVVLLAFWPPFLARHGPYIEDGFFLTVLHRIHGGQIPYRDFEFPYGPLMLYPATLWVRIVGFSMRHYYTYLALLEVLQYLLLAVLVQRLVPRSLPRVLVFVLLAIFLVNPLLGLNYNGLRKLLPAAALLLLARHPTDMRYAAGGGALLGLGVAYAHDFGLAACIGAVGMYLAVLLRPPYFVVLRAMAVTGLVGVAAWLAGAIPLLGAAFPWYLSETRDLVARFSAGEQGFRFYWTGHSLAAFALLSVGCVVAARGLARWRESRPQWGDRFLLAGLIATLVALKGGLNRSDVWHLHGAFFFLSAALVLPLPLEAMPWSRRTARVAAGLVAWMGATYLVGNAPIASYMARGWYQGMNDPPLPESLGIPTEAPSIEFERSHRRPSVLALAAYLAGPSHKGRPVLFYGTLNLLGPLVGVYKRDRLSDHFISSDQRGMAVGQWLEAQEAPIVVIDVAWYERLIGASSADSLGREPSFQPSTAKSLGSWLASVHYRGVEAEAPLVEARWRRTVGAVIRGRFTQDRQFGSFLVLVRSSDAGASK